MKVFREDQIRAQCPGRIMSDSEVKRISDNIINQAMKDAKANKLANWKRLATFIAVFVVCCALITITPVLAVIGSIAGTAALYRAYYHFDHILTVNKLISTIENNLNNQIIN